MQELPNISSELDHDLRLTGGDQGCHNLALVITNIHQILLRPAIFVYGLQDLFGRPPYPLYGWMVVHKMQQFYFSTVVKLGSKTQNTSSSTQDSADLQRQPPPPLVLGRPCGRQTARLHSPCSMTPTSQG